MGLETFTGRVSDLVLANPSGTDPKSQGDDHLRGIKTTIIGQSIDCQIGLSATPANNFTLTAAADNGTMKLARGDARATTQDILTVDAAGKVAFPAMGQSIVANGYLKLPGGLIVQWGLVNTGAGNGGISFPIQFPGSVFHISGSPFVLAPDAAAISVTFDTLALTGSAVRTRSTSGGVTGPFGCDVYWLALGA